MQEKYILLLKLRPLERKKKGKFILSTEIRGTPY